jgi:hypothetical protein
MGGNREINPLATIFASGIWEGRPPCRPVPLRHLLLAFGRDDLRVVRYRYDIRFWHLGGMTSVSSGTAGIFASCSWEGRPPYRPVPLRVWLT